MLVVYAAAILSFLGGARWGIAMGYADAGKQMRDFAVAILPALVGWVAVFLPQPRDLWTLAAAHVLLGLLDYGLTCRAVAPLWYGTFRLGLSFVAALALAAATLV